MPCAAKDVNASHISKDPLLSLQKREKIRFLSSWEVSSILILTSLNTQLPLTIGSPVFRTPVPVVQDQTNLLPVDKHLRTLLSLSVFILTYVEMAK